ncbi:MAG: YggT family protein [Actinomycetota bacterium]|nr:YggT family protein [Actinomycetota bacterium]
MINTLLCRLLQAYLIVMFARIILSWFPVEPGSGLASVFGFLYSITEPVLAPIRRVLPPIGMGGMGLDLSPIVVFFGITILQGFIC